MSSDALTTESILSILKDVKDPENGRSLTQQKLIEVKSIGPDRVELTAKLSKHSLPVKQDVVDRITESIKREATGVGQIDVAIETVERKPAKLGQIGLPCTSVIAVGSGKGGVGKSTVAVSIALALHRAGCRVGLLDTDVYGPSVPTLLGLSGQPAVVDNQVEPLYWDGMPVMSIGFIVPADQAVVWRGPMLHKYVGQFLGGTRWGDLDYLIIDMPPGTGDVALSLSQMLPISGSVVVCTPQDVALADAIKAVGMFGQVKIPVLGVVENMSGFVCPGCGQQYDIFGKGGAREYAEQIGVPFLGEVPIQIGIRENGDAGKTEANLEDPQIAPYWEKVTYHLVRTLADRAAAEPMKPQLPVLG